MALTGALNVHHLDLNQASTASRSRWADRDELDQVAATGRICRKWWETVTLKVARAGAAQQGQDSSRERIGCRGKVGLGRSWQGAMVSTDDIRKNYESPIRVWAELK